MKYFKMFSIFLGLLLITLFVACFSVFVGAIVLHFTDSDFCAVLGYLGTLLSLTVAIVSYIEHS